MGRVCTKPPEGLTAALNRLPAGGLVAGLGPAPKACSNCNGSCGCSSDYSGLKEDLTATERTARRALIARLAAEKK